ncbi:hypothetical protein H4W80_008281 [Nonomuraea angiospora]|uniref:DUF4265 domain-containing protein n=1 Tax=Nonomuraea angiospora TaxID=46172 RepID=A0ABR9MBU1_9ACTN|nr:hypothetical protein [Nonomuraea angiospora]
MDIKYAVKIVNTPLFASEIAYGDIVRVRPDHGRRELVFERLISESEHSAVRVILTGVDVRAEVQELVSAAGCTWESGRFSSLLAIDIPAEADYRALRQSLLGLKSAGKIGLQESAVSNVHRRQFESFP